jgi:hypothetical protein
MLRTSFAEDQVEQAGAGPLNDGDCIEAPQIEPNKERPRERGYAAQCAYRPLTCRL